MFSVTRQALRTLQAAKRNFGLVVTLLMLAVEAPAAEVALPTVPAAEAKTQAEMKAYTEVITSTPAKFDMLPIPGGKFTMGTPGSEANHKDDEGPQHEVFIKPFWMGKHEVTWNEFEIFMQCLDVQRRKLAGETPNKLDKEADAVVRPTEPYEDISFGMGQDKFPAICMTPFTAKKYCEWLSAKTGRYYRLPTEAEWEYACRAGTTTAYSFGNDPSQIGDYAWYVDNSEEKYHPVGQKKPNPWGLHDMHGNVVEICADQYVADFYGQSAGKLADNPLAVATKPDPCVVRGGSWDDDPMKLRSGARLGSSVDSDWKASDPQIPHNVWYYTSVKWVGFRVVRPLEEPLKEKKALYGPEDTPEKTMYCNEGAAPVN